MFAEVISICAVATQTTDAKVTCRDEVQQAEQLIADGAMVEARDRLLVLEITSPGDIQIQFLLGLISLADKNYNAAISRFRGILVKEPNAVRVRLELGRTYFQKGDFRNAERQFQFARSGKLPLAVAKNVDTFLANIRRNRTLEFALSAAIAPDTNINAGPSVNNVLLFGLPFQLSQDAKASSGVGIAVGGRVTWTPRISSEWRWDIGIAADARRYGQAAFNDTAIAAFTGPHLVLNRIEARLNARGSKRWYGGTAYADGVGGNFDVTYYFSGRTGVFSSVGVTRLDYPKIPAQSGVVHEYAIGAFHALTPSSIGRASVTLGRQGARAPALANKILGSEVNYLRELGDGFTVNLLGRYREIRYNARLPAFQSAREDSQIVTQATLLNRRIIFEGFTPTVAYTHTFNNSNLPLFRYRRSQFEFGLSRIF